MLKLKSNRKGSVPALLTLGLVLVGSLVTIGISFLTNNNKIASNPRAGLEPCTTGAYANLEESYPGYGDGCKAVCGTDCEACLWDGKEKWQCKSVAGGNVHACKNARTYATLANCIAEHKEDGATECKQCLLGYTNRVEYGGDGPPAAGGNPPPVADVVCPYTSADDCGLCKKSECVACNVKNFYCPEDDPLPENCKTITCAEKFTNNTEIVSKGTEIYVSTNITGPPAFYTSPNCANTTKVSGDNLFRYCYSESTGIYPTADNCVKDQNCKNSGLGTGNDTLYDKPYSYFIGNTSDEYHDNSKCGGNIIGDLTEYCTTPSQKDIDDAAKSLADSLEEQQCNSDTLCTTLQGIDANKIKNLEATTSYKNFEQESYYYESPSCDGDPVTIDKAFSYCYRQDAKTYPLSTYHGVEKEYNGTVYQDCLPPQKLNTYNFLGFKTSSLDVATEVAKCVDNSHFGPTGQSFTTKTEFYCCKEIKTP